MAYMVSCEAQTKQGQPCSLEAGKNSKFCHVHDPALQCGFVKRDGQRCIAATGGRGPCTQHKEGAGKSPEWNKRSYRKMRYSPEERRRRRTEREEGVREALAELDRIAKAKSEPIDWFGVGA